MRTIVSSELLALAPTAWKKTGNVSEDGQHEIRHRAKRTELCEQCGLQECEKDDLREHQQAPQEGFLLDLQTEEPAVEPFPERFRVFVLFHGSFSFLCCLVACGT